MPNMALQGTRQKLRAPELYVRRKSRRIDKDILTGYGEAMSKTIEFETELTGSPTLSIPPEIAAALPSKGKVTIVVVVDMDPEDTT